MTKKNQPTPIKSGIRFDPMVFLETAAKGRTIATYSKKQIIFAQGDAANAVFYIKKGKVKVTVVSTAGKEAVVAILGQENSWVRDAWSGNPGAWERQWQ